MTKWKLAFGDARIDHLQKPWQDMYHVEKKSDAHGKSRITYTHRRKMIVSSVWLYSLPYYRIIMFIFSVISLIIFY